MISSCPVVVTLLALVRRRSRRRFLIAWQILVIVVNIVVDVWRPRGGVVLAARMPTRFATVLVDWHPVAIPGASIVALIVTYIIGAVLRR
jgi:hypothetical protein